MLSFYFRNLQGAAVHDIFLAYSTEQKEGL